MPPGETLPHCAELVIGRRFAPTRWLHAGYEIHAALRPGYPPSAVRHAFGPQLVYVKAPSKEQGRNLPPSFGLQFFGHVAINGATEVMTVTLEDVDDKSLWSIKLEPKLG